MKTTGITRRIDELGRIVIPKEIRKNLHIKKGELLEIFLGDKETIFLKKHNTINKKEVYIKEYITFLAKVLKCNIFITNMDEIIFSNKESFEEEVLIEDISDILGENKDLIYLTKNIKLKKPYKIYSISPNGDSVGFIIFEFTKKENFDDKLVNFSVSFIENYLEFN